MSPRKFLTGLSLLLLATQACGSDDGKKRAQNPGEAGSGGEAVDEPSSGGTAAGEAPGGAGEPNVGGVGGTGTVVEGGAGGAAGEPSPPEPELLFSVKRGAFGLEDTAMGELSDESKAHTVIYTTNTGSQDDVDGTNTVKVTGVDLGLGADDEIAAFAVPQPVPENPVYLFSVADGSEGAVPTSVYDAWWSTGDEESQLYYSDGVPSLRAAGEGGDSIGYTATLATRASLGLYGGGDGTPPDDMIGLVARDARAPLTEIYFTVPFNTVGAVGSAVEAAGLYERSCTVFKSELDGTNTVAYTCDDLGLSSTGDHIDGLVLLADEEGQRVLFSVSQNSQGLEGSGVFDVAINGSDLGAAVFESDGSGTNTLKLSALDLGLGDIVEDDIDGLTIIDAPLRSAAPAGSCNMTINPFDSEEGPLDYLAGSSYIGESTLLLFGPTIAGTSAHVLAFNATTCALIGQQDLPLELQNPETFATVPLAGWSPAAPLANVEYFAVADALDASSQEVRRYDATGAFQDAFPITDSTAGENVVGVVYEPVNDRLVSMSRISAFFPRIRISVMPRPAAATTSLDASRSELTLPCADGTAVTGVDGLGNIHLARQGFDGTFRVCAFGLEGQLRPTPYQWTTESYGTGFITPSGSHFLYNQGGGSSIERSTF